MASNNTSRLRLILLSIPLLLSAAQAQTPPPSLSSYANLSTHWINDAGRYQQVYCPPNTFSSFTKRVMLLLLPIDNSNASVFCGFFCKYGLHSDPTCDSDSSYFSILVQQADYPQNKSTICALYSPPQVIWTANRDRPVATNATLNLTQDGNLILRDSDGSTVWSTNTAGRSVAGMRLTTKGSLMLFDHRNLPVWDSFDHPTDTWLVGQSLRQGKPGLRASVSPTNWAPGQYSLTMDAGGLNAYFGSNPPQLYSQRILDTPNSLNMSTYMTFANGSLYAFPENTQAYYLNTSSSPFQFMRLESDGHLRHYELKDLEWNLLDDVLPQDFCSYPTVCGEHGVCYKQQCSCPNLTYFRQADERQDSLGCTQIVPLSCRSMQSHSLIPLDNVSYFTYIDPSTAVFKSASVEHCKQACLSNCSCMGAFFRFRGGSSNGGSCYLQSQIFSMAKDDPDSIYYDGYYSSTAFLKVQLASPVANQSQTGKPPAANQSQTGKPPAANQSQRGKPAFVIEVTSIIGGSFALLLITGLAVVLLRRRKDSDSDHEDDNLDLVPGLPKRFSFGELKSATQDFSQRLGGGGFGSVFKGILSDGTEVAVKRLESVSQGKKEFLTEVMTVGSIHHFNLVSLIGFCTEKSQRLLVYDYMCNGSLDKWIFHRNDNEGALAWEPRRKIVTDIAKSLSYLHEECKQKIAHLDIKPQNILLDKDFNAKVSDFGLAKLIDRAESHVVTRMRGTPGYLAPEWLSSMITEKADVYSFGVVVLEIVCGRKNLDFSQSEECVRLLALLQEAVRKNRLLDIIDSHLDNIDMHENEIIEMMKLGMWCLQNDSNKRPTMSVVLKVLEGSANVEPDLDYNFATSAAPVSQKADILDASVLPSASLLSGPR